MSTITLYHGTRLAAVNTVAQWPKAKHSEGGFGFYVTTEINTARRYGQLVEAWTIDYEDFVKHHNLAFTPVDTRYKEGLAELSECLEQGTELKLNQHQADELAVEASHVEILDTRDRIYTI